MKVDVAIITALDKERDAVLQYGTLHGAQWTKAHGTYRSIRLYHLMKNNAGVRIALVKANEMGPLNAAVVTSDVLLDCSPRIILLVGIAAGHGDDINLGDIIISDQVIDYEFAKIMEGVTQHRWLVYRSSAWLHTRLNSFVDKGWLRSLPHRPEPPQNVIPTVHQPGNIFSGSKVIADSEVSTQLVGKFGRAIGFEMEPVGVATMIERWGGYVPKFVMIKGVCDKADPIKGDNWHEYAASVAAAYALGFLNSSD